MSTCVAKMSSELLRWSAMIFAWPKNLDLVLLSARGALNDGLQPFVEK